MGVLDRLYADSVMERVRKIPPEATPEWGRMTPAQMICHVTEVVRYTMGHGNAMPYRGNWKSRYVYRPLILSQLIAMPRNVRLPNPDGSRKPRVIPDGTVVDLQATLDDYLDRWSERSLSARVHPFFGVVSAPGWRRIHYSHFEHHLAQFGV